VTTPSTSGLLGTAWTALSGEPELLPLVEVAGEDAGLLPSRLPCTSAMVAAVAASGLAVSALTAARTGSAPQPVALDAGHVALAARSERYAAPADGVPAQDMFAPLSRFWRTADGWLRLHTNYPWHRERALRVLGCGDDPDAVARAVAERPGSQLEEDLAAAGALGFAVRTPAEWAEHPQGRAVAALPLATWRTAGQGAWRPAPAPALQGVRVLDLTRVLAGPVATRTLAAWGADVLRIDSPRLPEIPAQALDMLSGKRSALLDLAVGADRERFTELLAAADVLVHGYRPGALDRYGLSGAELAEQQPHLSVVSVSAWGPDGPWSGRRGFDSLVQCPTGIAAVEGEEERPGALPAQVLDHGTGYLAAAAAVLSLAGAARGEPVRHTQLSLAQTAHWLQQPGTRDRSPERAVDPESWLVPLPGPSGPVRVIAPPGVVGEMRPAWQATTEIGHDRAGFADGP
jgi:crotonobetainyl-CoA:carnitine CoA-transferase CaiB-like acyl-CoA transferase